MCGIAGIAGKRGEAFSNEALVREMTARLVHRGPDDEGYYAREEIAFGHRRLSIIDLSTGKQPISNEDESVWITYNGEVYNFRELRKDLEAKGHVFHTHTDTEVVVHAYEEYGDDCVTRLRGMFAFAIWDEKQRTLFLARDHAGVKPLYYAELDGALLFASEMKALLACRELPRDMDFQAMDEYFAYLYTVPPRTIFKAIRQLPPAHCLTWKDGAYTVRRYWKPRFEKESRSESEWAVLVHDCLEETIQSNMVSDVPLGAFLSGGLDSGTIVAMMAGASQEPVRTFTIGFGEEGSLYDEVDQARVVADAFNTEHHVMQAEARVVDLLPAVVGHFDEPFGNPTAFLVYILSKLIREHVTVAVAGDGGDESFGGYARYAGAAMSQRFRMMPKPLRQYVINPLVNLLPESTRGFHALRRIREFSAGSLLDPVDMYASWQTYFTPSQRGALYTGDVKREVGGYDPLDFIRGLFKECDTPDFVSQAMYADQNSFLPHNVLHYSDRMSMAHSLEIRVPFTDPKLMELMAGVPSSLQVKGFETKCLMRKAMEKRLPREVVRRKKLGFNPPMGVWLNTTLRDVVDDFLSEDNIRKQGFFRPEPIRAMVEAHRANRRDFTWHIWALVFFEQWRRSYLDDSAR